MTKFCKDCKYYYLDNDRPLLEVYGKCLHEKARKSRGVNNHYLITGKDVSDNYNLALTMRSLDCGTKAKYFVPLGAPTPRPTFLQRIFK